jgi:hypothetical protein
MRSENFAVSFSALTLYYRTTAATGVFSYRVLGSRVLQAAGPFLMLFQIHNKKRLRMKIRSLPIYLNPTAGIPKPVYNPYEEAYFTKPDQ